MPKQKRVAYDQVAATYNRRFEENDRRETARALLALAEDRKARQILEVGCGTGRWLAEFSTQRENAHSSYGLDFSRGMLQQAQTRKAGFFLVQGQAEHLPYPDNSFDLIYIVNAFHHFSDKLQFIQEAYRLLQPGGALAIVGFIPQFHRHKWFIYSYYEGTYETDLERFSTWGQVLDWMLTAGFKQAQLQPVDLISSSLTNRNVLKNNFMEKNSCSQLALLTDDAYQAGKQRIEAAVEEANRTGKTIHFPVEIEMDMLVGTKPEES